MQGGRKGGFPIALAIALALPGVANADPTLPVGHANGVVAKWKRGEMVIVFTKDAARLYRPIAGKVVNVSCWKLESDGGRWGGANPVLASKRRRPIHTGDGTRAWDFCQVWLPARKVKRRGSTTHYARRLIVSIPLTQAGAVHVDEQSKAWLLLGLLTVAELTGEREAQDGYPAPDQLVESLGSKLWSSVPGAPRPGLIALAEPSQTPPPGVFGYYGDGHSHAAAVVLSATGRRLFYELDGDVLRTNVPEYVFRLE